MIISAKNISGNTNDNATSKVTTITTGVPFSTMCYLR